MGLVGQTGKVILQDSIAVFSGTVEQFLGQKCLSPLEKMARTPMHRRSVSHVHVSSLEVGSM